MIYSESGTLSGMNVEYEDLVESNGITIISILKATNVASLCNLHVYFSYNY